MRGRRGGHAWARSGRDSATNIYNFVYIHFNRRETLSIPEKGPRVIPCGDVRFSSPSFLLLQVLEDH